MKILFAKKFNFRPVIMFRGIIHNFFSSFFTDTNVGFSVSVQYMKYCFGLNISVLYMKYCLGFSVSVQYMKVLFWF